MPHCAYPWVCCELICSPTKQAITQKQREMLSCCSLIPSPWSNHVILSWVISASEELLASVSSTYSYIPFFSLKNSEQQGLKFLLFPPLKWIYTSLTFYLMKDLHNSICKNSKFVVVLLFLFILLKKQPLQLENLRPGKQIRAVEEQQHYLIFSTTLFMHEYPL